MGDLEQRATMPPECSEDEVRLINRCVARQVKDGKLSREDALIALQALGVRPYEPNS